MKKDTETGFINKCLQFGLGMIIGILLWCLTLVILLILN